MIFALLLSLSSFAAQSNHCTRYQNSPRYLKAIATVAKHRNITPENLCRSPQFLGIEAQPNRIVTREGEVIPHTSIQLHYYSSSCVYFVHDQTYVISKSWCYSGE